MTTESKTPRTDAILQSLNSNVVEVSIGAEKLLNHARTLELELAEKEVEIEHLKSERNKSQLLERKKYLPVIAALREKLAIAKEALLKAKTCNLDSLVRNLINDSLKSISE